MGMRSDITEALAEAFSDPDALADAVRSFTATREAPGPGTYNPATGMTEPVVTPYTGRGVFARYGNRDIDGTRVLATDTRLIALQAEVTLAPAVGDRIADMAAIRVDQDPAAVTWIVQLRG